MSNVSQAGMTRAEVFAPTSSFPEAWDASTPSLAMVVS
jgi:hypothetical protein